MNKEEYVKGICDVLGVELKSMDKMSKDDLQKMHVVMTDTNEMLKRLGKAKYSSYTSKVTGYIDSKIEKAKMFSDMLKPE